jgi:hypothetical protein
MRKLTWFSVFALALGLFAFDGAAFAQDGDKTLEERLEEIDVTDPDQLFEVASWAMKNKKSGKIRREGRKLLKEVIELDTDHAGARKALGHVKVGDTWYTSQKKADAARLKMLEEEMTAKGYVKFRKGFIKKESKRDFDRKTWQLDENLIWRSEDEIMAAKGYRKIQGVWVQMSEADLARADKHRKMTGEDLIVTTTPHYRFHMMTPPKYAKQYAELIESLYTWFFDTFEADKLVSRDQCRIFGGQRVDVWCFSSPQQFQDWVTTYQEEYKFTPEDKKMFRDNPAGWLLRQKRIVTVVNEKAEDMENTLLHQNGIMLLSWFALGRTPPWLREAFGHLCEHLFSGEKYGHVNNTTNSKYGGDGGIAGKEFNTKDMPPATKGIVKRGDDTPILVMSKLGLNSLNGDHLAQGYSHVEWMFNNHLKKMITFFHSLRSLRVPVEANKWEDIWAAYIQASIKAAFEGWSTEQFMDEWRKYVKKNYR